VAIVDLGLASNQLIKAAPNQTIPDHQSTAIRQSKIRKSTMSFNAATDSPARDHAASLRARLVE
jgi:hypothetical protein